MDWDARNEAKEFVLLASSHSEQPISEVTRRSQSPLEEGDGVVESEHVVIILNVVLGEQVVHLPGFIVVGYIHICPVESIRDRQRVCLYLFHCPVYVYGEVQLALIYLLVGLGDRLGVPEIMGIIQRS